MVFDEQSNSGFPVARSAPGQLDVREKRIDSLPISSLEVRTNLRTYAPDIAKTDVDWAVRIFGWHCTQTLASGSIALPPSSSTIH
jgi:hypothetical protein